MRILGIDTSTSIISFGIIDEDKIISEYRTDRGELQAEYLVSKIDVALNDVNLKPKDLDAFAVSIGPGSFTGLRVGLAVTKGFAFALNKPIIGVPTLDALAFMIRYPKYKVTPIMDARRGNIYYATYNGQRKIAGHALISSEKLFSRLKGDHIFLGNAVGEYKNFILDRMKNRAHFLNPNPEAPSGNSVAMLGLKKLKQGEASDLSSLEPIYLQTWKPLHGRKA
jgi:tRNA threonylcarbamoyladenosine biosynthesis protein TsaB